MPAEPACLDGGENDGRIYDAGKRTVFLVWKE